MGSDRIRVAIVDDHDMVREGLGVFLRAYPDMELVGEATSGEDALRLCESARIDILLMDLVMPGMGGISAIKSIHENWPNIKIIVLSSFEDDNLVRNAIEAGATSYLLKNISANKLSEAIHASLAGLPTFASEIAHSLLGKNIRREKVEDFGLTAREKEVLSLLAEGLSNDQISCKLGISANTTKNHVENIFEKMDVNNRTGAARIFLRSGQARPIDPIRLLQSD